MVRKAIYKVILVGDGGVGKTSIMRRFVGDKFTAETKMTIGVDFMVKDLEIDGQFMSSLMLWDFGGQERFRLIRGSYYKGAQGVILTFDLTRKGTLDNIKAWINMVLENAGKIPMVLVGNKSDLSELRAVTPEMGKILADSLDLTYIETSAKTGENVNKAFRILVQEIRDKHISKLSEKEFKVWQRKEGIYDLSELDNKIETAIKYVEEGKNFEAAEIYRRVADTYRLERDKDKDERSKEMINKALKYYKLSAEIYLKSEKFTEAAWSFEHLRSLLESSGDTKASLDAFIKSAETYEKAGNFGGAAWRYDDIANIFELNFEFEKAYNFYRRSWEAFLKSGEFALILEPLQKLSLIYEKEQNYDTIFEIWRKTIDKAVKAENYFWAGQILEIFINIYISPERKKLEYEKLLDLYEKAAKKFKAEGDSSLEAQSQLCAAKIAIHLRKFELAKEIYEKILNYYIEAKVWHQAARISTILGNNEDTIKYYKKEVEENKNKFYTPYLYIASGEYYTIRKDHARAIQNFRLGLNVIKELTESDLADWKKEELQYLESWIEARILFQEGVKFSEIDNHTKAQELYESAAKQFESGIYSGISEERKNLLRAFINLCNGLNAFEQMQLLEEKGEAEAAKRHRKLFNFNLNHANANFIKGGQFNISELINSILVAVEENEFSTVKKQASTIFSSFQPISTQKLSKLGLANSLLKCSIEEIKPLQLELNESCLVSVNLEIQEEFFSQTSDNWLPLFITCSDSLFAPIHMPLTLTKELPRFDYIFAPKCTEPGETSIKIHVKDIEQTTLLKSIDSDPIKVLRKYIPILINLTVENEGQTVYTGCTISGPITQKIKPIKLKVSASELLQISASPEHIVKQETEPREKLEEVGKKLYKLVIPEDVSKEIDHAINYSKSQNISVHFQISVNRDLMAVPFELLYSESKELEGYLSTQVPFFRYPTEKKITPIEKLTSRIARVLLIAANPLGGDYDLPGVDKETKKIYETLMKIGIQTTLITSDKATLRTVLEELVVNEYDAIHFSGHGFLDSTNPLESGLVLGVKGRSPEYLTAINIKEILQETGLKTIFLNSCYSAAQPKQLLSNTEVLGIADAFIQVGTPTLIGMQWPITDDGAVMLSEIFYEEVFRKNVDFQTALTTARLQLIRMRSKDPSWACPMLVKHPSLE